MKKLLCLLMAMLVVFAFAACGGDNTDSNPAGSDDGAVVAATSIKFDAESYTVGVEEYIELKDHITVEPAGATAEIKFSCSDETIAEVYSATRGEFYGLKSGEVTVTATAGKLTATCKLIVAGVGNIVARDNNVGGITNKRWGAVEYIEDTNAYIIIISKGLTGADMSKAVNYADNAGEKAIDGSCAVAVNGYYIAKTGDTGNYKLENVPEGEYVGIIISSADYTSKKAYDKATALSTFKASAIASYFTDSEADSFVEKFFNREFYVGELTVTANTNTVFGNDFKPDLQ